MTTYHITFSESAAATIKFALKKEDIQQITFPGHLEEGPIYQLADKHFEKRLNWLQTNYHWKNDTHQIMFQQAVQDTKNIPKDAKVIIWATTNAGEQFGVRLVAYLLQHPALPLYICDATKNVNKFMAHRGITIELRHSGEISAAQVQRMMQEHLIERLSSEQLQQLAVEGEHWLNSHSTFRVWHDGAIHEMHEEENDDLLIQYVKEFQKSSSDGFVRAVKVIGHALGESEYTASDSWFDYRLRKLIAAGVLEARGSLQEMRLYDVRTI